MCRYITLKTLSSSFVLLLSFYITYVFILPSDNTVVCSSENIQGCYKEKSVGVISVVTHFLKMSSKEIRDILVMAGKIELLMLHIRKFTEDSEQFSGVVTKPFVQRRTRHTQSDIPPILINPDELAFTIDDIGTHVQNECGNLSILTYVHSSVSHKKQRDIIRKTWGNQAMKRRFNMLVVYFVGQSNESSINRELFNENAKHKDIVQANFRDTYNNLTLKSISALKWINLRCKKLDLILKVDDDVFVNPVNFHKLLHKEIPRLYFNTDKMILCKVILFNFAHRDSEHKWHDPIENYRYFNYPQYCQGSAYMMTSATVSALYEQSFGQEFHKIDDLVVTGMLAQKAGVSFFPLNPKYLTSEEDHDIETTLQYMNGMVVFSINPISTREQLWDIVSQDLQHQEFEDN